jgi:hypothetical protein
MSAFRLFTIGVMHAFQDPAEKSLVRYNSPVLSGAAAADMRLYCTFKCQDVITHAGQQG